MYRKLLGHPKAIQMRVCVTWGNYDLTYITTELMNDVLVLSRSASR